MFQQILGFALIWWGLGGVSGADSFLETWYYSGVVFFTVGFGEVLPTGGLTRFGALVEAGFGVATTALVIGYLPSLYGAYSERERQLMTIDDGSDDRITPTNLVIAWAPGADTDRLNAKFAEWEQWASEILETHSTLPLLRLFRSHDRRQNWVTALGLLTDAAIHAQLIVGCTGRTESYWFLRRATTLFEAMTEGADLEPYAKHVVDPDSDAMDRFITEIYEQLEAHGFELIPFEEERCERTSSGTNGHRRWSMSSISYSAPEGSGRQLQYSHCQITRHETPDRRPPQTPTNWVAEQTAAIFALVEFRALQFGPPS